MNYYHFFQNHLAEDGKTYVPGIVRIQKGRGCFAYDTNGVLENPTDPYPYETYHWPSNHYGSTNMMIPDLPGVYVVTVMNPETMWHQIGTPELIYVGMASNLRRRIQKHDKLPELYQEFSIVKVSFVAFRDYNHQLLCVNEKFLIKTFAPSLNIMHNPKRNGKRSGSPVVF